MSRPRFFGLLIVLALVIQPSFSALSQTSGFREITRVGRGLVQSAAWHPDGEIILVNSVTGAWLYRADDFADIAHIEGINFAHFSTDGRWLLGRDNASGQFGIWSTSSYERLLPDENWTGTYLSPDGAWLLTVAVDGEVRLRDTQTFTAVELPAAMKTGDYYFWSPHSDGLMQLGDGQISLWHLNSPATRTINSDFSGHPQWSPDGAKILQNNHADNRVNIWDAATAEILLELPPHESKGDPADDIPDSGRAIWTPDSQSIIRWRFITYYGVNLQAYDVASGELKAEWDAGQIFGLSFSPDGQYLVSTYDTLDSRTFERVPQLSGGDNHSWSADSQKLALTFEGAPIVEVVDVKSGQPLFTLNQASTRGFIFPRPLWSPDGSQLLVYYSTGEIEVHDGTSGAQIQYFAGHIVLERSAFNDDGTRLAVADSIGGVQLYDTESGEMIARLEGHEYPVSVLAWQPGGHLLATRNTENSITGPDNINQVRVWNGDTGQLHAVVEREFGMTPVRWSPDGSALLSGYQADDSVMLWDPFTGLRIYTPHLMNGGFVPYPNILYSPDETILMLDYSRGTHGGRTLVLFQADNLKLLAGEISHSGWTDYSWDAANMRLLLPVGRCTNTHPSPYEVCGFAVKVIFDRAHPPYETLIEAWKIEPTFTIGWFDDKPFLSWSPSRRWVGIQYGETFEVWAVRDDGAEMMWRKTGVGASSWVLWSPDEKRLLLQWGDYETGYSSLIVDAVTGETLLTLENTQIKSWSPDGALLFGSQQLAEWRAEWLVFDVNSGERFPLADYYVEGVWSADGQKFAVVGQGVVSIWERF